MKLIADSGSTKTDWAVLDSGVGGAVRVATQGVNPILFSDERMSDVFGQELLHRLNDVGVSCSDISEVAFYGAGCTSSHSPRIVRQLSSFFPAAHITAESDLLGAARAVLGHEEGIACILGTGSNSCVYDGETIQSHIPPLGYVLGDEGSGAVLGRHFLNGILKGWLPSSLRELFFKETSQSYDAVIDRVYRQPLPNRYLATIVPFILRHISEPSLRQLVADNFDDFFQYNILRYHTPLRRMACVGGMATPFQDILKEVAEGHGFDLVRVMRSPIEGLVQYHHG